MRRALLIAGMFAWTLAAFSEVARQVPAEALPGIPFRLTNQVSFDTVVTVHAVEEELPAGWTASAVSHGGTFDSAARKVKWGPFFDATPRALSCAVTPGASVGTILFHGKASYDGIDQPISGAPSIRILSRAEANQAVCVLPEFYSPGLPIDFLISISPALNTVGYAIEDSLPAGWTASAFTEGGAQIGGKLRWGPFFDSNLRALRCVLLPPASATGAISFAGVASFDGTALPIAGARQISPLRSRVERTAPLFYQPGLAFSVQISATPAPEINIYSLSETIPAGWTADGISGGGIFDAANSAVKWGPFFDGTARALTYVVHPAVNADAPALLTGRAAFNNETILTLGPGTIFPRSGSAVRQLPLRVGLLENLTLTNLVVPKPGSAFCAVQDKIPLGWTVSAVSDGGVFDAGARLVKWGPFSDDTARALTCQLTSSLIAGPAAFQGAASFDGVESIITGPNSILVEAPPAALNLALRDLPSSLRPGSSFILSNLVSPANLISVYAVEEHVPAGWTASEISDGGSFDARNNLVKWGPFFDHLSRTFTCRIRSPLNAAGAIPFSGHGSFDGLEVSTSGDASLAMAASPNRTPIALDDTLTRPIDGALAFPISRLLANDSDPDNDALTLTQVASSARGFGVSLLAGVIRYAPAPGFNEPDSFQYTIRDTDGAAATATVHIQPPPPGSSQNIISIELTPGGALVRFNGIPGFPYDIQAATNLAPLDWTTRARKTADPAGRFEFLDTAAGVSPQRFYRTLFVE